MKSEGPSIGIPAPDLEMLICPCGDEVGRHQEAANMGCSPYESGLAHQPIFYACHCQRSKSEALQAAFEFLTSKAMRNRLRGMSMTNVCERCNETTLYESRSCIEHGANHERTSEKAGRTANVR